MIEVSALANKQYRRGVEIERKVVQILNDAGYEAQRMAQSRGRWDVVGVGPVGVRLIQVKRAKKDSPWEGWFRKACEAMRGIKCPPNVSREVWVWIDYQGFVKQEVI